MTGRRTSARNLKNRNEMEAKEKPEEDEEPLPEKRARTSTRSDQFDYSLIRRTRRSKKTAGEEEKVQTKKRENKISNKSATFSQLTTANGS